MKNPMITQIKNVALTAYWLGVILFAVCVMVVTGGKK